MSLTIANHVVDEDKTTCARCGMIIPHIKIDGRPVIVYRQGEVIGVIESDHGGVNAYLPNPIRAEQDPCEP